MTKMNFVSFGSGNVFNKEEQPDECQKKKYLKDIRTVQILNKIRKQNHDRTPPETAEIFQSIKLIINTHREKARPLLTSNLENKALENNPNSPEIFEARPSFIKIDPIKVQMRSSSQKSIKCFNNKDFDVNVKSNAGKITKNSSFLEENRSKRAIQKFIPFKDSIHATPMTQTKKDKLKDLILIPRAPLIAPPPTVSSKSWLVFNGRTNRPLWGSKQHKVREIASLTKIMTAYVVLQITSRLNIQMDKFVMRVSKVAASVGGTSANLQEGDRLSLKDLLFGLMLPSGNDAAYSLAENFGIILYLESLSKVERLNAILLSGYIDVLDEVKSCKSPVVYFVEQMNRSTKELNMHHTVYCNPHGLISRVNRSTAVDIAQLSSRCMQIDFFRTLVASKRFSCVITTQEGYARKMTWVNTNKLLDFGFEGIKTGYTDTAGPCLAASYRRRGPFVGRNLIVIIVLLASKTLEHRWEECNALVKWVFSNLSEQL